MAPIKQFPLPDVGEGLTEAEIVTWHVSPGDTVTVNQVIVEIETAKAAVELPCPYAGVVTELFAEAGATLPVGAPLLAIDLDPAATTPEAPPPADAGAGSSAPPARGGRSSAEQPGGQVPNLVGYGPRTAAVTRRPRRGTPAPPAAPAPAAAAAAPPAAPVPAAPVPAAPVLAGAMVPQAKPPVRKLARELGIDLRTVLGSGAGGVITREDVQRAREHARLASNGARSPAGQRREPIRGVRKATAAAVVASAFTAPHVTEFLTVDVTPMMELRGWLRQQPQFREVKLTPLAFAAKALCLAVRHTPQANASWDEAAGEIVYFDYVHLGIAAATSRGLVVPKIRDADRMSLRELAVALDGLTTTAREGRTPPGDMTGGTITITNVGVYGVDTGTPILNPGESAILALGAIRDMPWVVDGAVAARKVCQLALSFDHRVVDGQQGSQFLADIGALLADPALAITY
ncbi:MAG TPA: dihydrolipoamide acetyltransferase family protein [Pseudonocardiaceae bacterium]|jgi:pyruvate dehydrogenase E2 component (dihydrolipoamide acetyltransferase)|nr:dihydrolipoamide acetyltransferase family protein [Pseudonocardiaceae bacterium]